MTLQKRLEELGVKDGDRVIFNGRVYTFESDSWFYGSLKGKDVELSPNAISRIQMSDDSDVEIAWHFKRTCTGCGYVWGSLHCIHESRECPKCKTLLKSVEEPEDGCDCEFDY